MPRSDSLGQLEQLVLSAVVSLEDDAYGVSIHKKVEELAAPKRISLGAIYVALDRLEEKGHLRSWLSEPTAERGGRAKRCYKLEASGEKALKESIRTAQRMVASISEVWGEMEPGWGKA